MNPPVINEYGSIYNWQMVTPRINLRGRRQSFLQLDKKGQDYEHDK